jgi:glycosyltransferase involved in cell wall biosynthesis
VANEPGEIILMQKEKMPKVSVCVIAYNQEKCIRQCLQSIVDQEANFDFEVIIGEDCSTDGTRGIVLEFAEKYPDVVKPIYHEKNAGGRGTNNLLAVYSAACGNYIAHMDGDDYMLPGKLQLQVDELEKNPDCVMCVHEMKRFDQQNERFLGLVSKNIPVKSNIEFLLMNLPFFAHSSKMYRAECRNGLELESEEILDCYFHVHHALTGNILYLNKPLGVHRLNSGDSKDKKDARNTIYKYPDPKLVDLIIDAIEYAKRSGIEPTIINRAIAKAYFNYSYSCLLANNYDGFQVYIIKSIETMKINQIQKFFASLSNFPSLLFLIVRCRAAIRTQYYNFTDRLTISKCKD